MSDTRKLSVLVVEDDAMVRGWITLALEGSEFWLAGAAFTAAEALALAERRRPDLFLVDFRLPDLAGTELIRELRRSGHDDPVLLMTANAEEGFNEAGREAGAHGTVVKSGKADELLGALRALARGEQSFDVRHPARAHGRAALTPRERETLRLVARGRTNRQIADELGLGSETVKTLLARAFAKLGVSRRAEAVAEAQNLGLL